MLRRVKNLSKKSSRRRNNLAFNKVEMRELILKMESLKDSKEWQKIINQIRKEQEESNQLLLEWGEKDFKPHTEAEMIRHEISIIDEFIGELKLKDKEVKEALVADLEKSKNWRIDRLLWKTHEYKLDTIIDWDYYTWQDFIRAENRWLECLDNLPNKVKGILEEKEKSEQAVSEAEIQENLDALSDLELNGL